MIRQLEPNIYSFQDVIMRSMGQHVAHLEKVKLKFGKESRGH